MKDYQKGKIYKIIDNTNGKLYVGSTCEPKLSRRLAKHVSNYRDWLKDKGSYVTSFEVLEGGDYDIVLIENFLCDNSDELLQRERHYFDTMNCVNKVKPILKDCETKAIYDKEYRTLNMNKIKSTKAKYYEKNSAELGLRKKQYYKENAKKIKAHRCTKCRCLCGMDYTLAHKQRHLRTPKHKSLMDKFYEDTMKLIDLHKRLKAIRSMNPL